MPPKQRRKCKAKRTDGDPCKAWALIGSEVCGAHGGRSPQAKRKAAERRIEQELIRLAENYLPAATAVADPLGALLDVAGEITHFKDFLGERVSELRAESWRYEGDSAEQLRAEVALYERALDRTAKVLVDIVKLGLEERQTKLAEAQAAMMRTALTRIFDRLNLDPAQRNLIGTVVPEELRRIGSEGSR